MGLSLSDVRPATNTPRRLVLFGAAVALGAIAGSTWSVEASALAYDGLLQLFGQPSIQIASMAMGVGLAFLLGFVHIAAI